MLPAKSPGIPVGSAYPHGEACSRIGIAPLLTAISRISSAIVHFSIIGRYRYTLGGTAISKATGVTFGVTVTVRVAVMV